MALRAQEHDQLPLPNGWFAVGWSRDLVIGEVKPIEYFGEELVMFRARSGEARVLDPFCPHLGAHFGHGGRVMGETIRCPFHGWQFDGASGACTHIPYCDEIPQRAQVFAWPVQEKNGMIFVWRHAEKKPPEWDFPEVSELDDPAWSQPRTFEQIMEAPLQDTHENNNDPEHFLYVHGNVTPSSTQAEYSSRDQHYRIVDEQEIQTPFGTFHGVLTRDSYGLGLTVIRQEGLGDAGLLLFTSTTPIDERRVISRWVLTATKDTADVAGEEFIAAFTAGVRQDLPIWKHKVHRARPVLCKADVHLAQFRKWARQFYSDPVE